MQKECKDQSDKLSQQLSQTEQTIGNKFDLLSGKFTELKKKQEEESNAQYKLESTVNDLQVQVDYLRDKIEQGEVQETNVDTVVEKIKPLVTEALSSL